MTTPPRNDDSAPARRLRVTPVSGIAMRRRQWLWNNYVPLGELTIAAGPAGTGKSQHAVWLASAVSRGTLPGELYGHPTSALYMASEDSWSYTLAPRFHASGADLDRVHRLYAETVEGSESVLRLPVDVEALGDVINETDASLIVFDALLSTMSGDLVKQGVVRSVLEPISRLAQDMNVAILGIAHFRKAGAGDPLNMISGSAEFGQVVRSAIGFARDRDAEDGSCVMSLIKTNIAPQGLPSIRYRIAPAVVDTPDGPTDVGTFEVIGETDQSVGDLLDQQTGTAEDRSERTEAAEWLREYLLDQGGSAKASDVLKAARADGIAEATLKRARSKAGISTKRQGFGKGSVWSLDSSGSHSAHSAQASGPDPNELNVIPMPPRTTRTTEGETA